MVVFEVCERLWSLGCSSRHDCGQADKVGRLCVTGEVLTLSFWPSTVQTRSPVLAYRSLLCESAPAELGFRLPKRVEQTGQFTRDSYPCTLMAFSLGELPTPCLQSKGTLDPDQQIVRRFVQG
jgi:hypothetical protein